MMDRLTNIETKGEIYITDNDETRRTGRKEAAYAKLKEYEDAEDQGLLVRIPYTLGTRLYYANIAINEVCPAEIIGYEINSYTNPHLWIEFLYISKWTGRHVHKVREDSALSELLFLTAAEAGQALKEQNK